MIRLVLTVLFGILIVATACFVFQRKLLYYPTHHRENFGLSPWIVKGLTIGYAREMPSPEYVWLMLHGNGGQASDRVYALPSFSPRDAVFILEYPGYGSRSGCPSSSSFNAAARQAYATLRSRFPDTPVGVVGESIGSGPAAVLAKEPQPPDKIVLIVPFDTLSRVASRHFPFLPMGLFLKDKWNNVEALETYAGPLDIFGARDDVIIPIEHARALAASKPDSVFHEIAGGHNDWAEKGRVRIEN